MKIGVFDSGIGGKAIADSLQRAYPESEILYVNDKKNVPYGIRTAEEIIRLTDAAIQPLIKSECEVIVLACNTATAAAIDILRERYHEIPFVGLEPMVKTASELTKTNIFAVCGTPFTIRSERYMRLKKKYAQNKTVLEPDCSQWASMIEADRVDREHIAASVNEVCEAGADVIVLACTHYHWIEEEIKATASGRAAVINPSEAISRRVGEVLGLGAQFER